MLFIHLCLAYIFFFNIVLYLFSNDQAKAFSAIYVTIRITFKNIWMSQLKDKISIPFISLTSYEVNWMICKRWSVDCHWITGSYLPKPDHPLFLLISQSIWITCNHVVSHVAFDNFINRAGILHWPQDSRWLSKHLEIENIHEIRIIWLFKIPEDFKHF